MEKFAAAPLQRRESRGPDHEAAEIGGPDRVLSPASAAASPPASGQPREAPPARGRAQRARARYRRCGVRPLEFFGQANRSRLARRRKVIQLRVDPNRYFEARPSRA